jgi:hypothetical protein
VRYASIIFAVVAAAGALSAPASAATPAQQSTGKALVLVPLTLVKIDDLDFGSVVPSASLGVVTINASTGARTLVGGVTGVPSAPGNRAYFGGAGTPSQQVIMTMNPPTQLTSAASDTITVLGFTFDGSAIRTIDPVTRAFYVGVGGTLQIDPNQAEGIYSATFDVTANYM